MAISIGTVPCYPFSSPSYFSILAISFPKTLRSYGVFIVSNIDVVSDPPVTLSVSAVVMDGRGDSIATSTTAADIPDISASIL